MLPKSLFEEILVLVNLFDIKTQCNMIILMHFQGACILLHYFDKLDLVDNETNLEVIALGSQVVCMGLFAQNRENIHLPLHFTHAIC